MATRIQKIKWNLYQKKSKKLMVWGLENGYVIPYDDELLNKLRNIYYGGIPASIILLSNSMSNGHCYDRATLLAMAFLDTLDDINLLYASVDSLKLNPKYLKEKEDDPLYADHCIVERITKDGRHLIYDTSAGFIYDKDFYWLIERPKVRKVNNKESIKKFVSLAEFGCTQYLSFDNYVATIILPLIEKTYGRPTELYSQLGIELLQREIDDYKKRIGYDDLVQEIYDDKVRMGLIRK